MLPDGTLAAGTLEAWFDFQDNCSNQDIVKSEDYQLLPEK